MFWPTSLADWVAILSAAALGGGAVAAVLQYRRSVRQQSVDLLLRLEDRFQALQSSMSRIERPSLYATHLAPALRKSLALRSDSSAAPLTADEAAMLSDLDRLLRFFFLCSILAKRLGADSKAALESFYYHVGVLRSGQRDRLELREYLAAYYPKLSLWIAKGA